MINKLGLKHIFKHKLRDTLDNFNFLNEAKRRSRSFNIIFRDGKTYPGKGYKLVWEPDFTKTLNTEEWGFGMPWGDFHPEYLHQYYDNDGTLSYINKDGELVLELRKRPKSWIKSKLPDWRTSDKMPSEFTIPVGVGFVHTKKSWKYGWFTADIKLPKGQSYWPAFWTASMNSWPPEIDILEAYSEKGPEYEGNTFFGLFKKKGLQHRPNLHYGKIEDGTKDEYGAWDIPIAASTERFVQYALRWEKDLIEIYYDGIVVFRCTDPEILKWYNKEGSESYLIFNHGLHQDYPDNPNESAMLIKNIQVWQKD